MGYSEDKENVIQYVEENFLKNKKRISKIQQFELKKKFEDFIFIDDLCKYLLTTTTNHTVTRIDKKLDEFYDIKILEAIIDKYDNDATYRKQLGRLSLDKIKTEMHRIDGKNVYDLNNFKDIMNNRKLSNYLRKDLGLLYYEKNYITRKTLQKIILDDYRENTFKTDFNLKYLIKAMVIRVMPRSENTGFVNKRTRKVRKNYNLFLSLDWGYADNVIDFNYRKVKELSELLCLKLKETFFNEIKHIELGVATVHITTFKREDKEKILKMIRNNLIITSKEVLNEKYEKKKGKENHRPIKPII